MFVIRISHSNTDWESTKQGDQEGLDSRIDPYQLDIHNTAAASYVFQFKHPNLWGVEHFQD